MSFTTKVFMNRLEYKKMSQEFYKSREWREIRYKALVELGRKCMLCNATNKTIHVDHIKPLSLNWHLRLDFNNLQILCEDCNLGKSNKFEHDFRKLEKKKVKQHNFVKTKKRKCRHCMINYDYVNAIKILGKKGYCSQTCIEKQNQINEQRKKESEIRKLRSKDNKKKCTMCKISFDNKFFYRSSLGVFCSKDFLSTSVNKKPKIVLRKQQTKE